MIIKYKTGSLEKVCTNLKEAKKKFSGRIPEKLLAAVNYIKAADNLRDVVNYSPFHFHDLHGDRNGKYAIDIGGRTSGVRLVLSPQHGNGQSCSNEEVFGACAITIVSVYLEEVTNHYE